MNAVEAQSRKGRKNDASTERLVNTARLGVLGKALGIEIKRYKDPGGAGDIRSGQSITDGDRNKPDEQGQIIMSGF